MKVFKGIMWTLSTISIIIIAMFLWCYFFVPKPQTVGVVNISTLSAVDGEDVPLEDGSVFIEANLLTNKNENGKTLAEIQFLSYMGISEVYKKSDAKAYGYGFQLYDFNLNKIIKDIDYDHNHVDVTDSTLFGLIPLSNNTYYYCYINSDIYSYAISNLGKVSESVAVPYSNHSKPFIISVKNGSDNIPLELNFRGNQSKDANHISRNPAYANHPFDWSLTDVDNYFTIDMNFLISQLLYSFKSLSQGTHYIVLDLSDYFECHLYNEETKQFDIKTADTEFTWVTIKVNVSDDGITTHNQSMFGMVASNDGSVTFENDSTVKYWKVLNNIYLTLDNFEKRKSSIQEGYFLYLSTDTMAEINSYSNNKIHILINLSEDDKILGFDNFALFGLDIYSCDINASAQQDFILMPNCLDETGLNISDISTTNITIVDLGGIYG